MGTQFWPPLGTATWPPVGTFPWPRTKAVLVGQDCGQLNGTDITVAAELLDQVLDLDRGLVR